MIRGEVEAADERPGAGTTSALDLLRQATADEHLALHALPAFAALAGGNLDRDGYAELMARLWAFHAGIAKVSAPALALWPQVFSDHRPADRPALIAADLSALVPARSLPAPLALPAPATPAALAGLLYVVEGSVLGGGLLAAPAAAIAGPRAAGYWHWCRTAGPARWRAFRALLDRAVGGEVPAAIAAATHTFRAFGRAFETDAGMAA